MNRLLLAVLFLTATSTTAAAQLAPQDFSRVILIGGVAAGGGGNLHSTTDTALGTVETNNDFNLNSGGLVGLQFETTLAPYFILGGRFAAIRYDIDDASDTRRTMFDFGITPTAALDFHAGPLVIEPRVGIPLGFSLHHANSDDSSVDSIPPNNPGFHLGVLGGVHIGGSNRDGLGALGGLIEFGYLHHAFYADGASNTKYSTTFNQFVFQAGLSYTF